MDMGEERVIVNKRFAGEQHDIRDFVTPNQIEIVGLYEHVKDDDPLQTAANCWSYLNKYVQWPANKLGQHVDKQRLVTFGGAFTYNQPADYWQFPYETTARVRWAAQKGQKTLGDCADVTLVLASVIRHQLGPNEVFACMGTYKFDGITNPYGHAWVKMRFNGHNYYLDPTREFGKPIEFNRYEEYIWFNDALCFVDRDITGLLYP